MTGYRAHPRGEGEDRRERDARIFVQNLEDLVADVRPGQPVPGLESIDGTDATGTVYCVVNVHGAVSKVGIDPGWWEALGPSRIADAILEAMRFAKSKASMARLILDRHGHRPDIAKPDFVSLSTSEPSEELPPYDADDFSQALARKLNRTFTILDEIERFRRVRDDPEQRAVTGPRGMFRLILRGYEIVGAEVNQYGLRRSDAAELAEDARCALLAALPETQRAHRTPGRTDD